MSNRRKLPPDNINDAFAAMDGQRTHGGCSDCDAFQEVVAHGWGRNIHRIKIAHDDWCPTYRRLKRQGRAL